MTALSFSTAVQTDLAGPWSPTLSAADLRQRLATLTQRYVTIEHLQDRLEDLPQQFQVPRPRRWMPVAWSAIGPDQVSALPLATCGQILLGAINTEAPIHDYTQASRQYLEQFYPQMAQFVGGTVDSAGHPLTLGLWEREEKRHTPTLATLYTRLLGEPPQPIPHLARPYTPGQDGREDLYRHGLHRIATEYGAACLYLWMMAYTTGPLQAALGELLIDEINHMTKFWGFGRWAYPSAGLGQVAITLGKAMVQKLRQPSLQGSLAHTLRRMMGELAWPHWSLTHRFTFLYTADQIMRVLWQWDRTLSQPYLNDLFGHNSPHQ
ncbi:MAG: ferritin-like domain-containing protein [Nodosilinea sp.]